MRYRTSALLLCLALCVGAASTALAQAVQRSGATFHVAVCPGPAAPGTARCHAHVVTDRAGNPIMRNVATNATPSGYGPSTLQAAYSVAQAKQTTTPNGPVIAIVDAYGYSNAESNLGTYRAQYGLPPCTTANGCFKKVNQSGQQGNYPSNNTGWAQEQALDIQMVSAICPNCRILLVEASSASFANLGTAENRAAGYVWPDGSRVHAISNSYGGSESGTFSYDAAYYTHPNIAITVSTGDSGYGAQFPATSPHVTAVGGTSLVMSGNTRVSETAWSGGGSGCSAVFQEPSWQNPVTGTLCGMRLEADTSAVADPNTGVAVYGPAFGRFSGWLVFGGTSVAAPLTAAIYGLNGSSVNYGSNPYIIGAPLFDITSGSNGSCGSYFCNAGTGYDGPTGLGTPNGAGAF